MLLQPTFGHSLKTGKKVVASHVGGLLVFHCWQYCGWNVAVRFQVQGGWGSTSQGCSYASQHHPGMLAGSTCSSCRACVVVAEVLLFFEYLSCM